MCLSVVHCGVCASVCGGWGGGEGSHYCVCCVCVSFGSPCEEWPCLHSCVSLVLCCREPQPVEAIAEKIQATGDDSGLVSFTPRKIDIK